MLMQTNIEKLMHSVYTLLEAMEYKKANTSTQDQSTDGYLF